MPFGGGDNGERNACRDDSIYGAHGSLFTAR